MSTNYNEIFLDPWADWDITFQPSCLQRPYVCDEWPIKYPPVLWNDRSIVVMHCQDFLTMDRQGCPELRSIERYFDGRSPRVIVIHWNYDLSRVYDGPLNLVHFPTHTWEILMNLRSARYHDWKQRPLIDRHRRWQCLNGIPRPHRRQVHSWLKPLTNGITCLGNIDPLIQDAYHDTYTWTGDPLINENNLLRLHWLYEQTWINIVTETQYDQAPGIISEKTLFAFLSRQIPIFIGYRGIVEDCRRLGFDVFDDIVDHGYDDLDDQNRWRAALELNEHLIKGDHDFDHLLDRLQHQRDWCLDQWPSIMIENYGRCCQAVKDSLTKQ